jgi:NAD(P)-dependent dehydrogenase (short-subunit alcohol dehydrogenase family)
MNLAGRVALVTGSGRGIGKAIAQKLSEVGAIVVINDVSDTAEAAAQEIISTGRQSLFIKGSVSSSAESNDRKDNSVLWEN